MLPVAVDAAAGLEARPGPFSPDPAVWDGRCGRLAESLASVAAGALFFASWGPTVVISAVGPGYPSHAVLLSERGIIGQVYPPSIAKSISNGSEDPYLCLLMDSWVGMMFRKTKGTDHGRANEA